MSSLEETTKQDLVKILQFSSRYDLRDSASAKKILNYVNTKKIMTSSIGKEYVDRLNRTISGSGIEKEKCILCKKEEAKDGIFCTGCMAKYSGGKLTIYKSNDKDSTVSQKNITKGNEKIVYCRSCGSEIKQNFCENCGAAKGEGYEYCACCGSKVPLPPSSYKASLAFDAKSDEKQNRAISGNNNKTKRDDKSQDWKKYSPLSGAAVVFSIFLLFPIGLILALIDLSKKDGRKHGNDVAAIIISCLWILALTIIFIIDGMTNSVNKTTVSDTGNSEAVIIDSSDYMPCTTTEVHSLMKSDYASALTFYQGRNMAITGRNQSFDWYSADTTNVMLDNGCILKFRSEEQRTQLVTIIPPNAYITLAIK